MTQFQLLEPEQLVELQNAADNDSLIIFDVRGDTHYLQAHIPGARHLAYGLLVRAAPPAGGLLPTAEQFNEVVQAHGISKQSHVVVYDAEGGAAASRLVWNLFCFGFTRCSLLNGGIVAWHNEGLPLTTEVPEWNRGDLQLTGSQPGSKPGVVTADQLLGRMTQPDVRCMDTRSIQEYIGASVRATNGGRIPGAIHLEWLELIDRHNAFRLHPREKLQDLLSSKGFDVSQEIVVYCQTHHRSALNFFVLQHLGYSRTVALDGAWSVWGNRPDCPFETG